ncbi:MAG TPA: exodeoxyribonuclease III [Cyanothece sp. UBA12306]|nr:exodeoxyribonuclease III [Cyanothece sp. UBA12306]
MKIATWNVNSIRTRQPHVIDWLETNKIDILCLQETKVIDPDFPKTPFEELGYNIYIYGQKAYNGVAIFSREPLADVSTGFSPIVGESLGIEFDEQKRVITGVFQDIRIVNLYVPNGSAVGSEKYDYKLRWLKVLKQYLSKLLEESEQELCICGDFNIALEDKDIYNSTAKKNHIMSSPLEREALKDILEIGLQDAFRKFTTEAGHFSWWDYRAGGFQRNRGWRIDHHYLTPKLYEKAINCTIDIEPRKLTKPSDHTPVIVEF